MSFRSLRLYNFRNLEDATLTINAPEVFLVGANGQGKTNFLEAIYLVCYGSSFRTRRIDTLRRHDESEMAVDGVFDHGEETHRVQYRLAGRERAITVDGVQIADRSELVQNVPCIVFCHDDFSIVVGSPDVHRWFFDQTATLLDHTSLAEQRLYQRVLRSRNAALREGMHDLVSAYDEQLVDSGLQLYARRADLVRRFSQVVSTLFERVFESTQQLTVEYRASWQEAAVGASREALLQTLQAQRGRDNELATTTSGPHRDRFLFRFGTANLADVGSTGQLRLVSLLLRVAQATLVAERTGRLPVLLLDDVLLELDPRRRERLLEVLPEYEQAFFTFLPDERYAGYRKESTMVLSVENGSVCESGR